MIHRNVFHNGKLQPIEEVRLSPGQGGLLSVGACSLPSASSKAFRLHSSGIGSACTGIPNARTVRCHSTKDPFVRT
jgi:hypothetical protein